MDNLKSLIKKLLKGSMVIGLSAALLLSSCDKEKKENPLEPNNQEQDNVNVNPGVNGVVINEVYYNSIDTNDLQWVEIFNPTDKPVDMSYTKLPSWWLNILYVGFGYFIIQPNEYIIIVYQDISDSCLSTFKEKYNISNDIRIIKLHVGVPCQILDAIFGLMQFLDENLNPARMQDASTNIIIDLVHYDGYTNDRPECIGTIPPVSPGQSIARYKPGLDSNNMTNDFYIEDNPTPGKENNQ